MKIAYARRLIFSIFLISLLLSMVLVATTFITDILYFDESLKVAGEIGKIYAVNFAVILPGVYTNTFDGNQKVSKLSFYSAAILSIIWNLVVIGMCFALWWFGSKGSMHIGDFFSFSGTYVENASFLITAGLAFFFINQQSTPDN